MHEANPSFERTAMPPRGLSTRMEASSRQARVTAWIHLVLAILVFAVPFTVGPERAWHHFSNYTVGAVVALLAVLTISSPYRRRQGALANGFLELAFGGWVLATGVVASSEAFYQVANIVLGVAMGLTALWSLGIGVVATREKA